MFERILFIVFLGILIIIGFIIIYILLYVNKTLHQSINDKAIYLTKFNANAKPHNIVFLGDSLTEFYRTDEFFESKIYNRGIAGDDTIGVLKRLEDNVIKIKPSKIFLQIGTNDLGKRYKYQFILNNIKLIINTLKEKLPTTSIYYISLYPINSKAVLFSKLITGPRKNIILQSINEEMKVYCNNKNIKYIDVWEHLIDQNGNLKQELTIEGLHINYNGYVEITKVLLPYVNE